MSQFGLDNGLNIHGKHQPEQLPAQDPGRVSPISYQPLQIRSKPITMPTPRAPLTVSHMNIKSEVPATNHTDDHSSVNTPSPISPSTTRCPSLTESFLTATTCPSPTDSGPATPISEHGGPVHVYPNVQNPQGASRVFDGRESRYLGTGHCPLPLHKGPNHGSMHAHSLQMSVHSGCLLDGADPDTPMMIERQEEKITQQEKRRRNHLKSEKRRRENIKDGMDALLRILPPCNVQESKATILRRAEKYILRLKYIEKEVIKLREVNGQLETYLALQNLQTESLVYRSRM